MKLTSPSVAEAAGSRGPQKRGAPGVSLCSTSSRHGRHRRAQLSAHPNYYNEITGLGGGMAERWGLPIVACPSRLRPTVWDLTPLPLVPGPTALLACAAKEIP